VSMILSENRFPVFGIMRPVARATGGRLFFAAR
jgi:hypothetical protein